MGAWSKPVTVTVTAPEEAAPTPTGFDVKKLAIPIGVVALFAILYKATQG